MRDNDQEKIDRKKIRFLKFLELLIKGKQLEKQTKVENAISLNFRTVKESECFQSFKI